MVKRSLIIFFSLSCVQWIPDCTCSPNIITDSCTAGTVWERQASSIFPNWCLSCYCISGNLSICARIIRVFAQSCDNRVTLAGITINGTVTVTTTAVPPTATPVTVTTTALPGSTSTAAGVTSTTAAAATTTTTAGPPTSPVTTTTTVAPG